MHAPIDIYGGPDLRYLSTELQETSKSWRRHSWVFLCLFVVFGLRISLTFQQRCLLELITLAMLDFSVSWGPLPPWSSAVRLLLPATSQRGFSFVRLTGTSIVGVFALLSALGAAYGTAKSGTGIAAMSVMRPELIMKSIIPVVMAGIIAIYGLVVAVLIGNGCKFYVVFLLEKRGIIPKILFFSAPVAAVSSSDYSLFK